MTEEELNIETAKICGWTGIQRDGLTRIIGQHPNSKGEGSNCGFEGIPSYAYDFNAICAAEVSKGLTDRSNPALRVKWQNSIHKVMAAAVDCPKNKLGFSVVSDIDCLLMTPRQRTEAFVLTFSETKVK